MARHNTPSHEVVQGRIALVPARLFEATSANHSFGGSVHLFLTTVKQIFSSGGAIIAWPYHLIESIYLTLRSSNRKLLRSTNIDARSAQAAASASASLGRQAITGQSAYSFRTDIPWVLSSAAAEACSTDRLKRSGLECKPRFEGRSPVPGCPLDHLRHRPRDGAEHSWVRRQVPAMQAVRGEPQPSTGICGNDLPPFAEGTASWGHIAVEHGFP